MPSPKNINPRLLAFIKRPEHHSAIQQWRQKIENKKAKTSGKPPKNISVREANQCFLRGLRSNRSPYAKGAEALLRKWLPTPPAMEFFQNRESQKDRSSDVKPQAKVQRAVAHFRKQAQDFKKQIQHCSTEPQRALLKKQTAAYNHLALTLAETADRMNAEGIIEQLNANPALTLPPQHPVVKAYKEYETLIGKAVKLGLGNDPYVHAWLKTHPRHPKPTSIMSRPITGKELECYEVIDTLRGRQYSWHDIHNELMKQGLIPRKSWQAFQKWLTRRNMQKLYGFDD